MRKAIWAGMLLMAAAAPAGAGVVVTQEETHPDSQGGTKTVTRTAMIQGNKQKTSGPDIVMITDLDSGVMITLNEKAKTATEITLSSSGMGGFIAAGISQQAQLKPTGAHKTVAGYGCDEFKGTGQVMGSSYTMVACFSKEAPGAAEYAAFYKKLMAKMGVTMPAGSPEGIALATETETKAGNVAMPGVPPEVAKKIAEAQAKAGPRVSRVQVTSVKTQVLPADAFAVPAGYTKQNIDVMMGGVMKGKGPSPAAPEKAAPAAEKPSD